MDLCTAVYSIILDRINYENEQLEIQRQKIIKQTNKKKQQQHMNAKIRKKELIKRRSESDRTDIKPDFKSVLSSKVHNIYDPDPTNLPTMDEQNGNA